jgi:predicted PurR-regulated permease PerM
MERLAATDIPDQAGSVESRSRSKDCVVRDDMARDGLPQATETQRRVQRVSLGILTGLSFVVVAWMAAPLLVGLALGTVMAFTAQPGHARLTERWGHRRVVASAVTTLLGGLAMAGGGAVAFWIVARETGAAVALVQRELFDGTADGSHPMQGPRTTRLLAALGLPHDVVVARLRDEFGRFADLAAHGAGLVVQVSAGALLTIVVALWTMFYVLQDWPRIAQHLQRLLPLDPRHTRALVDEFRDVGRRAFVGTVASAIIQGTAAGVGFALFGVPGPMTWGALLALLSFIPVVGTLIVWVGAALWLVTIGHTVQAILLTLYSLLLVMAGNDYVIRPRLVGRGGGHPLLTLVALIGGISVFGVAGVIVGPIIASLFVASARIFEREREDALAAVGPAAASPPR